VEEEEEVFGLKRAPTLIYGCTRRLRGPVTAQ
jgi:hypothetical protein